MNILPNTLTKRETACIFSPVVLLINLNTSLSWKLSSKPDAVNVVTIYKHWLIERQGRLESVRSGCLNQTKNPVPSHTRWWQWDSAGLLLKCYDVNFSNNTSNKAFPESKVRAGHGLPLSYYSMWDISVWHARLQTLSELAHSLSW